MSDARSSTDAGWYADPFHERGLRWWDGTGWTDHVSATRPYGPVETPSAEELRSRVGGRHAADDDPAPGRRRRSRAALRPRDDRAAGRAAYGDCAEPGTSA